MEQQQQQQITSDNNNDSEMIVDSSNKTLAVWHDFGNEPYVIQSGSSIVFFSQVIRDLMNKAPIIAMNDKSQTYSSTIRPNDIFLPSDKKLDIVTLIKLEALCANLWDKLDLDDEEKKKIFTAEYITSSASNNLISEDLSAIELVDKLFLDGKFTSAIMDTVNADCNMVVKMIFLADFLMMGFVTVILTRFLATLFLCLSEAEIKTKFDIKNDFTESEKLEVDLELLWILNNSKSITTTITTTNNNNNNNVPSSSEWQILSSRTTTTINGISS